MNICHISPLHAWDDQRIFQKECISLARRGHKVIFLHKGDRFSNDERVIRIPLQKFLKKNRLTYFLLSPILIPNLKKIKIDILHIHEPDSFILGVFARIAGIKVVYDAHEDYKKVLGSRFKIKPLRPFVIFLFSLFERFCFLFWNKVIGATESISKKYGNSPDETINNYPKLSAYKNEKTIQRSGIVYVGGITKERGLNDLLDWSSKLRQKVILAGPVQKNFKWIDETQNYDYKGMLPSDEVPKLINNSKLGVIPFHPQENYLDSKPTKLYEYMASGVPVVVPEGFSFSKFVAENKIGKVVKNRSAKAWTEEINNLLENEEEWNELSANCHRLSTQYSWENEEKKLFNLYDDLK